LERWGSALFEMDLAALRTGMVSPTRLDYAARAKSATTAILACPSILSLEIATEISEKFPRKTPEAA